MKKHLYKLFRLCLLMSILCFISSKNVIQASADHPDSTQNIQLQSDTSVSKSYNSYVTSNDADAPQPYAGPDRPLTTSYTSDFRSYYLGETVKNYIYENSDHTITRFTYDYVDNIISVEKYNPNFEFVSRITVPIELDVFGGFYCGKNYNFIAFGQNNKNEDDSKETLRIVRYSKDWKREKAVHIMGEDIYTIFDAGMYDPIRFFEQDGSLHFVGSHEGYDFTGDGLHHQYNLYGSIRISDMTVEDFQSKFIKAETISHSIDQHITADSSGKIWHLYLGDGNPRSVNIARSISLLDIKGPFGYNTTGVNLGGFESSGDILITAGTSVDQTNDDTFMDGLSENVFVAFYNVRTGEKNLQWITNYDINTPLTMGNIHLVKITDNKYAILWTENYSLKYTFVNATGNRIDKIYTADTCAQTIDCVPSIINNKLTWFFFGANKAPTFITIDLNTPSKLERYGYNYHQWNYAEDDVELIREATCVTQNITRVYCSYCSAYKDESNYTIPSNHEGELILEGKREATCLNRGYSGDYVCNACHKVAIRGEYSEKDPNNHTVWFDPVIATYPTCTTNGVQTVKCASCGYKKTESIPATGHNWNDGTITKPATVLSTGEKTYTCKRCSTTKTEIIPKIIRLFDDVLSTDWFYPSVKWAVDKKVTNGTSPTTFSPNKVCTRAQIVTFLWNAAGQPSVSGVTNPFTDVKPTDWYYKAVLWAVNKKITNGTTPTTFSPNNECTRAQVVTFLWNWDGQPKTSNNLSFTDVSSNAYYYTAVKWAAYKKVTNGTGDGSTFSPEEKCTRAQVVTFIYNYYKNK